MNTLDTRDLEETREELKQTILDSFQETFTQYEEQTPEYEDILWEEEEIENWKEYWLDDIAEIAEIETLEEELGSYFKNGCLLIDAGDFEDYAKELFEYFGEIPSNLPAYIERHIDWDGVRKEIKAEYSEVEYQGTTYLYRA